MARLLHSGRIRGRDHQPLRKNAGRGRGDPRRCHVLHRDRAHGRPGNEPRPRAADASARRRSGAPRCARASRRRCGRPRRLPAAVPRSSFARNPEPHSALLSGPEGGEDQGQERSYRNAGNPGRNAANARIAGSRAPSIVFVGLAAGAGRRRCDVTDCEGRTDMSGDKSHMHTQAIDEALLVNFLLGKLTEEEQVRLEDRAFADREYLSAIDAAEVDLIDAYVAGDLSKADRRAFEQRFLTSSQRRSKLEFAQALARVIAPAEKPATGWLSFLA